MHPDPTEHLTFRPMTDADLDDMCRLLGDPEVMRHYPHPKSTAEVQQWIDWTKDNYELYGFGLWVIEDRTTGAFVGDSGLTWQTLDGEQLLEVGYHLLPAFQGRGLATEAARACVDYGFDTVKEDCVTAIVAPDNTPSRRVAEHLGMTVTKTTADRSQLPVVVYSLTR